MEHVHKICFRQIFYKTLHFFNYISVPEGSTTPTKSLKSRMMEKFGYGKSPGATSTPIPIGNLILNFSLEVFSLKIANFLSDEPSVSCKMVANNLQGVSGSHSPKEDPFLGN